MFCFRFLNGLSLILIGFFSISDGVVIALIIRFIGKNAKIYACPSLMVGKASKIWTCLILLFWPSNGGILRMGVTCWALEFLVPSIAQEDHFNRLLTVKGTLLFGLACYSTRSLLRGARFGRWGMVLVLMFEELNRFQKDPLLWFLVLSMILLHCRLKFLYINKESHRRDSKLIGSLFNDHDKSYIDGIHLSKTLKKDNLI